MKKIITIIGARPQIIKSAALSRAIAEKYTDQLTEVLVHTGQHYDEKMSEVFFTELGLKQPDYNLNIGSNAHGLQTAEMIIGLEKLLVKEKPDAIVVYGDTNSTLAGAITGSKLGIPIVHIEAGLRSFNKSMPEEVNRIMCDHVSTLLFSPTETGVKHLENEGFKLDNIAPYNANNPKVYHSGDVMYDNSLYFSEIAAENLTTHQELDLHYKPYFLATVHRGANTDDPEKLKAIFDAFLEIIEIYPDHLIVLPLHPRTHKCMEKHFSKEYHQKIKKCKHFKIIPPVSFLTIISLEKNCELVITDSGGLQKEAYFFKKPCVILRPETEWVEIVEQGVAMITDADQNRIVNGVRAMLDMKNAEFPSLYGDGKAAEFIAGEILEWC
ncbi:UDP-N-acetylglucosamine 2-epimerase (non-hydrolyzing) [Brumimicrobium salinarum]|uniref:UDP-N-acetylglucosamine 2-epimerase (Non-hydrolyzing) n=1 Tax=Brumimicrobium salinarum TaxID=2058658 RepID=A0A2I0R192_9FLAO|nr:UDP-N-acetylglucosamine 2-epimerase (non-hydrolyzing) [Brumimicrobium salinarum]PKR80339.1 UDP-N-acetylglucosamine 2-epimerase (non-hydrolyzing) [Brumimicrobium salinarum]